MGVLCFATAALYKKEVRGGWRGRGRELGTMIVRFFFF